MQWVDAKDGRSHEMESEGRLERHLASGTVWTGLALEAVTFAPQELPDCYVPVHLLGVFDLPGPIDLEHRYQGQRQWRHSTLVPGGLFLYSAFSRFRKYWSQPIPSLTLQIDSASIPNVIGQELQANQLELRFGLFRQDSLIEEILRAMKKDVAEGLPGGRLYGETLGVALVTHLFQGYGTRRFVTGTLRGGLSPRHLSLVREYIQEGLGRDLSLAELAGIVGLNHHHFARAFRQSTGLSPARYVLQARVARACAELRDSELGIAEIAARSGYGSQGAFTTAFRRVMGCTPSAYRRTVG